MNFAQLVDPDRLRSDDPLARKPSPQPPMGLVEHINGVTRRGAELNAPPPAEEEEEEQKPRTAPKQVFAASNERACRARRSELAHEVRIVLSKAPTPFVSVTYIAAQVPEALRERGRVYTTCMNLVSQGDLARNGPYGMKLFGLTAKGRAYIQNNNGGNDGAGENR